MRGLDFTLNKMRSDGRVFSKGNDVIRTGSTMTTLAVRAGKISKRLIWVTKDGGLA